MTIDRTQEPETAAEDAKRKTARRKRLFAGCVVVLCLYLCGPLFWLGPQTFTVLAGADRVQVFKIDPNDANDAKETDPQTTMNHHTILAAGQDLSGEDISRLKSILLSPNRYIVGPLDLLACKMSPGIAFRLWRGRQYADMTVCYECGHIFLVTRDEQGRELGKYYTPFSVPLLSGLVRGAFPGDTELAGTLDRYEVNKGRELRELRNSGTIKP